MTRINAYLHFDGNCREAMTFYKDCLGGELVIQPVEGSPVADQMPPEARQGVLHSCLTKDALVLMASDLSRGPVVRGHGVSLLLDCVSAGEIQQCFSALSSGGETVCPLGESFWGATFGSLTDRYGIHWSLVHDKSEVQE